MICTVYINSLFHYTYIMWNKDRRKQQKLCYMIFFHEEEYIVAIFNCNIVECCC